MKKYLVLLCTKTLLNFVPPDSIYKINVDSAVVKFRKITTDEDELISGLNFGWMIEVKLEEENVDKAVSKATEISEFFLSAFCFETAHPISTSKIILIYDISNNVEKRVFRQYFYNLPMKVKNADVEFTPFVANSEKIWMVNKHRDRIHRSLRWLRKGINADDPLDQFLFFWHGLESLNPVLAEYFGTKNKIEKNIGRKCKHCGKNNPILVDGGIEELYKELGVVELSKEIKKIRNGISHGYESIAKLTDRSMKILPDIASILHKGISLVLGISSTQVQSNLIRISPIKIGEFIYEEGVIREAELSLIGMNGYYPYIKMTCNGEGSFNFQNQTGCDFDLNADGVAGKDITITRKYDD